MKARIAAVWLVALILGFARVVDYELGAGAGARPGLRWPAASALSLDPERPTLLLFVHPRCPCSGASVAELNRLLTQCPERASVRVLAYGPEDAPAAWWRGGLVAQAEALAGVRVVRDTGGEEARRFGAHTSGQALLFRPDGELAFHGGITPSRGHRGDNAGRDALVALLRGERPARTSTPVFGCGLGSGDLGGGDD